MADANEAIDDALERQDAAALRAALAGTRLGVLFNAGQDAPPEIVHAPLIGTLPDGSRRLIVLTGLAAKQAFAPDGAVAFLSADDVVAMALRNGVDAIAFNPAGPRGRANVPPRELQLILDGLDPIAGDVPAGRGELREVRPAGYDPAPILAVLAPLEIEAAYAFDRVEGERSIPTLGLVAPDDVVRAAAGLLQGGIDLPVLDLVQLDAASARAVGERVAASRLR